MRMMKIVMRELNLRCFLTVLFVNKLGHLIEFRPREVQTDPNIFTLVEKKKKALVE